MTVLNPFGRVDEHIMDDADLAGPLLFILCFGMFLLLVCLLFSYI
jgi:protein YIPF5/7